MQNRHRLLKAYAKRFFFKDKVLSNRSHQHQNLGGAERDRTADPLLAKQVLSQLSYSPIQVLPDGKAVRISEQHEARPSSKPKIHHQTVSHPRSKASQGQTAVADHSARRPQRSIQRMRQREDKTMVGPGRLELPTPRLSSVCSNQLSYGPIRVEQHSGNASSRQPDDCRTSAHL